MKALLEVSVKKRLLITTIVIALGMLLMLSIKIYYMNRLTNLGSMLQELEQLNANMLMLRRNEKDFLARNDMKYVERLANNVGITRDNVQKLSDQFMDFGIERDSLTAFLSQIDKYHDEFKRLVAFQQEIGLHPKDGLYGGLRTAVHDVEASLEQLNNYKLLTHMLQLRRNEKDFMLRLDLKYLDTFDANISDFMSAIESENFSPAVANRIVDSLTQYQNRFRSLVEKQQQIGLTPEDGVRGEMRSTIHQTETALATLQEIGLSSLQSARNSAFIFGICLFAATIAIIVLLVWLVTQSILTPLTHMGGVVRQIRENNDLTLRITPQGKDEIASLAGFLNVLLDAFRDLINDVDRAVQTLNTTCSSLALSVQSTSKGMAKQQTESDMVATAATEMQASIKDVSRNTTLMADQAEQTSNDAMQRKQDIDHSVKQIQALSETLNQLNDSVNKLEADSQTIGSVLDVIRGIAEQTNLLALNAAIEAARAGEQGRGFAVVADEVRNLAMRTQESTLEIESIITNLQARTNEISNQMQDCQSQGLESAQQVSEAGESLNKITSDIKTIMEMTAHVAVAIDQQSQVASEVNENVVRIRDIASEVSDNAKRNAQESNTLDEQAKILAKVVGEFKT
ncbi:HAMP domain-containing methyl-accepting chemotaxis protein [Aestuariibacter salexigens]|uniref:HAMP domain-containing methyl-accepting chemotaxis protein n=1 Tax=Aestuariibacter salexigens TaxID=226010 RepID=UPI0004058830|nr:methyl-accepting chemotaxis protein [Aestuariibacter salexigens]